MDSHPSSQKEQELAPQCWIEECRKALLDSEKHNLRTRALYWTQIVNMKTKEFNDKLNIQLNAAFKSFEYTISNPITSHLNYLIAWKGLRSEKMTVMPQRYHEFEFKAKNWVCGRRAPNYANTLFPEMIVNAERYAHEFAVFLFPDSPRIQPLYEMGLMFAYLSSLCSSKITLNDRSKKTYLMFENSLKKDKNPTVQLLQKYASDIDTNRQLHSSRFPTNLQSAHQYFEMKYKNSIRVLREPILALYHQRQTSSNSNIMDPMANGEQELYALVHNILYLQQQQQSTMHHLTSRIRQLENVLINRFNIDLRSNSNDESHMQRPNCNPLYTNSVPLPPPQSQQQPMSTPSDVVIVPMVTNATNPIIYNNCTTAPAVHNVFAMISN